MSEAQVLPPELVGLDFDRLGCHWLRPDRRSAYAPAELLHLGPCRERLAGFIRGHGDLRPFKPGMYRTTLALFRQGGAGGEEARCVLERYFGLDRRCGVLLNSCGRGHPFDHAELWGKHRVPRVLVGHPYQVDGNAIRTLNAIAGLGLAVYVENRSWYGFGTTQVRVYGRRD